jgi:tetratricopeptide (TPR) repeat protein
MKTAARRGGESESNIMKTWIATAVAIFGIATVAGVVYHFHPSQPAPKAQAAVQPDPSPGPETAPERPAETTAPARPSPARADRDSQSPPDSRPASPSANPAGTALFTQAIESLVSPQSNFGQRYEAMKQLRKAGQLDQAIGELERRMADDPRSAECPAALGRAYLEKAGTIQDMREQGILAMKADQVFDAALNLDPENWDARFTKAVAMSYWPTQMNKGTEIIQHFSTLIGQQEAQAPQPQFAQTYAWMGDAYEKYGHPEYAQQVWQRGAALFPDNPELKNKLAAH